MNSAMPGKWTALVKRAGFGFSLPGQWGGNAKRSYSFPLPGEWGSITKRLDLGLDCSRLDTEDIYDIYQGIQVRTEEFQLIQ